MMQRNRDGRKECRLEMKAGRHAYDKGGVANAFKEHIIYGVGRAH